MSGPGGFLALRRCPGDEEKQQGSLTELRMKSQSDVGLISSDGCRGAKQTTADFSR